MVKRGSITVFLALTLGLILSLLSSGLESARMAAARTQILNGMDIGLYSLFGQYNKSFLKDFDLFAVDGACGGKEMNLASIYDNLESYMKPVMKQNSQKLSVQQGGISGYLLMTDSEGEVFYQQAVQYMKETLGSHGAKLLLNKIQNMQKKTIEAERQGNEIESKGTIENYESEMDSAQQKSQALLEEKKKQKREALLMAAFSLFTSKGINETSISDIASKANMAKGTFYLYFKDKYDIRDKLITEQARQLFDNATIELMEEELPTLEEKVLFIADRVIDKLQENKILMRFISKNLSWGVFHDMLVTGGDEMEGLSFYDAYYKLLEESGREFRNPDLMLFMIVELINSTCHNVILYEEPVTMDELKPELNALICDILHRQEI